MSHRRHRPGGGRHARKGRRRNRSVVDQTDVDGLNVPFAISPGDFEDITDMLVRSWSGAGAYRPPTSRERCAKNCLARAGAARRAASGRAISLRVTAKAAE